MKQSFSKGALNALNSNDENNYYVYRLVDPRTLHTFYVGKGKGNRVFDHANGVRSIINTKDGEDEISLKFQIISEILSEGKEVICIIHRWGISEDTAFEVESAVMDCYAGLANIQSGHFKERGMVLTEDFEKRYNIAIYDEPEEDYVLIKTTKEAIDENGNLYDATRRFWVANLDKVSKYKYALSVVKGVVLEVYSVDRWYKQDNRVAFEGKPTTDPISSVKGKLIPPYYRKQGMASPFLYKTK